MQYKRMAIFFDTKIQEGIIGVFDAPSAAEADSKIAGYLSMGWEIAAVVPITTSLWEPTRGVELPVTQNLEVFLVKR